MKDIISTVQQHLDLLYMLAIVWTVAMFGIAAFRRHAKGLPIRDEFPQDPLFLEKWTTGRSMKNWLSRWGGAYNSLYVVVTKDRLMVRPHFPMVLLSPAADGLEISVSRNSIRKVTLPMGGKVLIDFNAETGLARLELWLREPVQFRDAMAS